MSSEPSPTEPAAPPPPPGPSASRDEWRAWRHQQRDHMHWQGGPWYGPWDWWGGGWFWGAGLVVVGAYYLLQNLGLLSWLPHDVLGPILLILLGLGLLWRRSRRLRP